MTAPAPQSQQMTDELRHALLPWRISHTDGSNYALEIVTTNERGNEELVCRPPGKKRDGNAALIVEAVNSHEALKARIQELETALEIIGNGANEVFRQWQTTGPKTREQMAEIARAALSKGAA